MVCALQLSSTQSAVMEWLMGKARGVSRGIMSGSGGTSTTAAGSTSPNSPDHPGPPPIYTQPEFASQQLGSNSVDMVAFMEPCPHMEENEWLASHTVGLFDNVSTLYDAVYEVCSCPTMVGPGLLTYVATDDRGKKIKCTARQYMDSVLAQSHDIIKSTKHFPTRYGITFPTDFRAHVVSICRNLFQVLVHLYAAHFQALTSLELVPYINTVTKHVFLLNARFKLVEDKEVEVLGDLQLALLHCKPASSTAGESPTISSAATAALSSAGDPPSACTERVTSSSTTANTTFISSDTPETTLVTELNASTVK